MRFRSFAELAEQRAAETPDAAAFLTEQNGEKRAVTCAAFLADVREEAALLRATGRTCAGILCDGSYQNILHVFGAAAAGMQIVMLNENADAAQIKATDADLLLGDEELCGELSPALTDGVTNGTGNVLFFTSGTTAKNRAVLLTQENLCAAALNGSALLPLSPEDVLLNLLPPDHVFGFVCGLLWGMACGAAVALGRGPRHYFDDPAFFTPTALPAVPLLLGFLLQRNLLNPELRLVLIGAGDCPPRIPAALRAKGVRVSFGYGLTETASGVALSLGDDPYAMTVCPEDEVTIAPDGEIFVKSEACMMRGYYKDPAATAAVLQNGALATGDLGSLDENGLLRVTGRKKEILTLADGTKVFLPEYERALEPALAGRDYAVFALDGAPALAITGEESERAALTEQINGMMRNEPLGRRIRKILLLPAPLPRTATGKIKRWELQQKASKT